MSHTEQHLETVTFRPDGDVVASQIPALRAELFTLLEQGVKYLIVDLQRVTMVDSSGLGLLIALHNALKERGGALTVTHASADLCQLFRIMRLDRHFTILGEEGAS